MSLSRRQFVFLGLVGLPAFAYQRQALASTELTLRLKGLNLYVFEAGRKRLQVVFPSVTDFHAPSLLIHKGEPPSGTPKIFPLKGLWLEFWPDGKAPVGNTLQVPKATNLPSSKCKTISAPSENDLCWIVNLQDIDPGLKVGDIKTLGKGGLLLQEGELSVKSPVINDDVRWVFRDEENKKKWTQSMTDRLQWNLTFPGSKMVVKQYDATGQVGEIPITPDGGSIDLWLTHPPTADPTYAPGIPLTHWEHLYALVSVNGKQVKRFAKYSDQCPNFTSTSKTEKFNPGRYCPGGRVDG